MPTIEEFKKFLEKNQESINKNLPGVAAGIQEFANTWNQNTELNNLANREVQIDSLNNTNNNYADYDSLVNSMPSSFGDTVSKEDVWGKNDAQAGVNALKSATAGAAAGAAFGGVGALVGAGLGLASGVGSWIKGSTDAYNKAKEINRQQNLAKQTYLQNFSNNAENIANNTFNAAVMNIKANGGNLDNYSLYKIGVSGNEIPKAKRLKYSGVGNTAAFGGNLDLSGDWSNGVKVIENGGTHEGNKLGGVPMGIDEQGIPNLVEEGEVIFNDYVYSNRLKPTEEQLKNIKLDTKYKDKTFAEIAKDIQKPSAEMPNDSIAKNTMLDSLGKLMVLQEESRAKEVQNNIFDAGGELARYIPVVGTTLQSLTDSLNLTNKYDYSNAELIKDELRNIKNVSYTPNYSYMTYNPINVDNEVNKNRNMALSAQRGISNSANNKAAAVASLMALNNQSAQNQSDLISRLNQYNDNLRNQVAQYNNSIHANNAGLAMQAAQLNQQAEIQRLQGLNNYAQFRDNIDTAMSQVRSANRNAMLQNFGNLGIDQYNKNLAIDFLRSKGLYDQYINYMNGLNKKD